MSDQTHEAKKGFTLIELLIVIGVLGILAGIILVAVDPAKRLEQARDARRFSEVNSILNAILNYTVDSEGTLPASASWQTATSTNDTVRQQLGTATAVCGAGCGSSFDNCLDLSTDLVDEYIAEMPIDPQGTNATTPYTSARTGYYAVKTSKKRIEVGSCNPERPETISSGIKIKR